MQHQNAGQLVSVVLALGALVLCRPTLGQERPTPSVLTCQTATNARTGQAGVTYSGTVSNSDYRFDATIPTGLTGLGADPNAPFHGFTIFLGRSACIVFQIQHVVVLPDDEPPVPEQRATRVRVGGREALEYSLVGMVQGKTYLNTNVQLELPRRGYKNGASIYFVTALEERSATEPVFRSFLAGIKFW